jgi:phosphoribosylanthranilate isomerase
VARDARIGGDRGVFHVKVCGVTAPDDARLVAAAGADAVGINFVTGSPRQVDVALARAVAAVLPRGVLRVGVFAGTAADEIRCVVEAVSLDAVQLHGQLFTGAVVDAPETCAALHGVPVIRAVRLGPDGFTEARRWFAAARALGWAPAMALVDAAPPRDTAAGALGGRGELVDWGAVAAAGPLGVPLALAGGLTAENVADAVRASGAAAVDTASGVESVPGRKDSVRVHAFVGRARSALGLPPPARSAG